MKKFVKAVFVPKRGRMYWCMLGGRAGLLKN